MSVLFAIAMVLGGLTPQEIDRTPAVRYARLDRGSCEAELVKRGIPFSRAAEARGVLAPVRLTGRLHGVLWRTEVIQRPTPYEILDCRLALAVDDFSAILAREGVVEAIHYSAYRPPSSKTRLRHGTVGARHDGGLAIDAGRFIRHDGSVLHIEKDFHGKIGAETCAAGPAPASPEAVTLHRIVCDAAQGRLFHVLLTPNNDWAHRNHFHLEVTANARWFILH